MSTFIPVSLVIYILILLYSPPFPQSSSLKFLIEITFVSPSQCITYSESVRPCLLVFKLSWGISFFYTIYEFEPSPLPLSLGPKGPHMYSCVVRINMIYLTKFRPRGRHTAEGTCFNYHVKETNGRRIWSSFFLKTDTIICLFEYLDNSQSFMKFIGSAYLSRLF